MKVWATTDRQASVMLFLWMSNTNWGFLITFTQNLRGRLWVEGGEGGEEQGTKMFLYLQHLPAFVKEQLQPFLVRYPNHAMSETDLISPLPKTLPHTHT